jgi:hypothetical protein
VLVAGWALLAPWTQRVTYQTLAVDALSKETRVLGLGTSHLDVMVDPKRIDVPMMNLPQDIGSYVCLEAVLAGNLGRLPNLELVLVEMDIVPLLYDTLPVYKSDYTKFLDLEPDLQQLREPWHRKLRLYWERALVYSRWTGPLVAREKLAPSHILAARKEARDGPAWPLEAGHRGIDTQMTSSNDGAAIVAIHTREGSLEHVDRNLEALLRILRRLRERGVAVVLVRFPHHHTYWEVRPATWDAAHARALEAVSKVPDLQGIPYWDFERSPSYPDAEFRDGDHLNVRGAKRFAEMLNRRILELLDSKRSSTEPGDRVYIAHSARRAVWTGE